MRNSGKPRVSSTQRSLVLQDDDWLVGGTVEDNGSTIIKVIVSVGYLSKRRLLANLSAIFRSHLLRLRSRESCLVVTIQNKGVSRETLQQKHAALCSWRTNDPFGFRRIVKGNGSQCLIKLIGSLVNKIHYPLLMS